MLLHNWCVVECDSMKEKYNKYNKYGYGMSRGHARGDARGDARGQARGNARGQGDGWQGDGKEMANEETSSFKRFLRNRVKGWIGEEVFAELLREEGYRVIKFGIESTLHYLKEEIKNNGSETAEHIRHIPDYIVLKGNNIYIIEIKATSKEDLFFLRENEYYSLAKWWRDAYLVVITHNLNKIKYMKVEEIDKILRDTSDNRVKHKNMYNRDGFIMDLASFHDIDELFSELKNKNNKIHGVLEIIKEYDNKNI